MKRRMNQIKKKSRREINSDKKKMLGEWFLTSELGRCCDGCHQLVPKLFCSYFYIKKPWQTMFTQRFVSHVDTKPSTEPL